MNDLTIDAAWKAFERDVLPAGCSSARRIEERRAFYAGAICMFTMVTHDTTKLSDAAAMAWLTERRAEIERYAAELEMLVRAQERR